MSDEQVTLNQAVEQINIQATRIKTLTDLHEADKKRLVANTETMVKEQVDAQVALAKKELMTPLGNPLRGDMRNGIDLSKNPYHDVVKDIIKQGHSEYWGGNKITAADLYVVYKYMEARAEYAKTSNSFANSYEPQNRKHPSKHLKQALEALTPPTAYMKYLRTDVATQGAEWTVKENARFLWEEFFTSAVLLDATRNIIPDMKAENFSISDWLGDFTWRKQTTQGVGTTSQTPTTGETILTTTGLILDISWTLDMDEDGIMSMGPLLRNRLVESGRRFMEDFWINGDKTDTATGNINSDDATPPSDSFYLATGQDGIRKMWLLDNSSQAVDAANVAITSDILKDGMVKLDKYYNGNTVWITNTSTWISMLGMDDVKTNDLFGPMATIHNGQLGSVFGKPIIISDQHPLTAADGKVDTLTTNDRGAISLVNLDQWWVGFKGGLEIMADTDIRNRKSFLVGFYRMAMAALGRTTLTHTAGIYNIKI